MRRERQPIIRCRSRTSVEGQSSTLGKTSFSERRQATVADRTDTPDRHEGRWRLSSASVQVRRSTQAHVGSDVRTGVGGCLGYPRHVCPAVFTQLLSGTVSRFLSPLASG